MGIGKALMSRRAMGKSTLLAMFSGAVINDLIAKNNMESPAGQLPHDRYPAIALPMVAEVVGVAHFDLNRLKQLVDPRPELAKATWDWGYGDWESAMGAATHVGRKDIITYLMEKGAAPSIFTFAVLGQYEIVKTLVENQPGIQRTLGPHGISLLQHARTGMQVDGIDKERAQLLIDYLDSLGDANGPNYLSMSDEEKAMYLGDYRYGEAKDDVFTIKLNMRKMLAIGKSGGGIHCIGKNEFVYQGSPSVKITFQVKNEKVISLTIREPGFEITAVKV